MTKVFISWSGDLSKELAKAVHQWLPCVLQFVKPYATFTDIERGTNWNESIAKELENSDIGIICLTKENLASPWILFESGALSIPKNLEKSRVYTILFGVEPAQLTGPLVMFQSTMFEKDQFKEFINSINDIGGDSSLENNILDGVFDTWWSNLKNKIDDIIENNTDIEDDEVNQRSERDLLEEVLERIRIQSRQPRLSNRVNPKALMDLVENYSDLQRIVEVEGSERLRVTLQEMQEPLGYLVRRHADSKVREHYQMVVRNTTQRE